MSKANAKTNTQKKTTNKNKAKARIDEAKGTLNNFFEQKKEVLKMSNTTAAEAKKKAAAIMKTKSNVSPIKTRKVGVLTKYDVKPEFQSNEDPKYSRKEVIEMYENAWNGDENSEEDGHVDIDTETGKKDVSKQLFVDSNKKGEDSMTKGNDDKDSEGSNLESEDGIPIGSRENEIEIDDDMEEESDSDEEPDPTIILKTSEETPKKKRRKGSPPKKLSSEEKKLFRS